MKKVLKGSAITALALSCAMLAACTADGSQDGQPAGDAQVSAHHAAAGGTGIPKVTVQFGMRPYPDNTFFVAGIKQGYFKDVGITIAPAPNGRSTTEKQWTSLLVNKTVDINSATTTNLLPLFKSTDQPTMISLVSTYIGNMMLANPKLHLKTLKQYLDEGDSFNTALKNALKQLSGKTVYIQQGVPGRTFSQLPFTVTGVPSPTYQVMDDSNMLLLAKSGKADFVNPSSSSTAAELQAAGWTQVYTAEELLKDSPKGTNSPWAKVVVNDGLASTKSYVDANYDTVLRFVGVVYREIAALGSDPALWDTASAYQNSVAGTNQSGAQEASTVKELDPLVPFDEAGKYFTNTTSPEYYASTTNAQIGVMAQQGLSPKGLKADDVVAAGQIYKDLLNYKDETDKLLAQVKVGSLSGHDKTLYDGAKKYYSWFDFLDAYRFARAIGKQ